MIWLTWRQFRTQALIALGALAAIAVVLVVTGPHLAHLYDTQVASCATRGDCASATATFVRNYHELRGWMAILVIATPGVIGVFWGAPLVARELETGTYRLAWTQSVTRTRWLAVKLGVVGVAGMVVAGLLSLMVSWWVSPIDRVNMNRFGVFDQRSIVPIAYAAFAFALGVTAGVLIRRTLPAMAATLVAFVAARLAVSLWVRPHLVSPVHRVYALDAPSMGFGSTGSGADTLQPGAPHIANAWIYSSRIVDQAGRAISPKFVASACPDVARPVHVPALPPGTVFKSQVPAAVLDAMQRCVAKLSPKYHEVVTYQPAARYWTFQGLEAAVFLGGAVVLAGLCFWWIRHRLA